jgi:hypothetical protein
MPKYDIVTLPSILEIEETALEVMRMCDWLFPIVMMEKEINLRDNKCWHNISGGSREIKSPIDFKRFLRIKVVKENLRNRPTTRGDCSQIDGDINKILIRLFKANRSSIVLREVLIHELVHYLQYDRPREEYVPKLREEITIHCKQGIVSSFGADELPRYQLLKIEIEAFTVSAIAMINYGYWSKNGKNYIVRSIQTLSGHSDPELIKLRERLQEILIYLKDRKQNSNFKLRTLR